MRGLSLAWMADGCVQIGATPEGGGAQRRLARAGPLRQHPRHARALELESIIMAMMTTNELLAAIRSLPFEERLRIIEQAARDVQQDTPRPPAATSAGTQSLLGLFSDEPDLIDEVCDLAYESRKSARMRNAG